MKKTIKKVFGIIGLLLLGAMISFGEGKAEEKSENGFTYYISMWSAYITGYTGNDVNVVIPEKLGDHKVVAIGKEAFLKNKTMETITIPESVYDIGELAFDQCSSLKTVSFTPGLKYIGRGAFNECSSLESAILSDNIVEIDEFAFYGCLSLKELRLPNAVKSYGKYAFYKCKSLETIVIPDCVETISESCFRDCTSLKNLVLSKNLDYIGWWSFDGCTSLRKLVIPPSVGKLDYAAFSGCKNLRKVTLNKGLVNIDGYVFYECDKLPELRIPSTVKVITKSCFPVGNKNFKAYVYSKTCKYFDTIYGGNNFSAGTLFGYADSTTEYYATNEAYANYVLINREAKDAHIAKVYVKNNKLKVQIKKAKHAVGYAIQYSTNSKFTKAKTIRSKKTKVVIPGVKKNKTYYVRVASYSKGSIRNVRGNWSTTKCQPEYKNRLTIKP